MRVLMLVCRPELFTSPLQPMFCSDNNFKSLPAASSRPMAPNSSVGVLRQTRLRATFAAPVQTAAGIEAVWVNGTLSYRHGQPTGDRAGRWLPRNGDLRKNFL